MDDLRIAPHSPEAESAVLGSLLIDGEAIHSVHNELESAHFFLQENQWVYDACLSLCSRGEAIDQLTIAKELNSKGRLEEVSTSYLSHLVVETPTSLHIEHYARIVKACAVQRMAISVGQSVMEAGYQESDPLKLVANVEGRFLQLQKSVSTPHLITPHDLAEMGLLRYHELNEGHQQPIYTGFAELDRLTLGMFPGEYWLLGARPGVGKTTIAQDVAQNVGKHGNVLYCTLEMSWGQMLDRFIGERISVHPRVIGAGKYSSEELYGKITSSLGEIAASGMYFYEIGNTTRMEEATTSSIFSLATHMKLAYGLTAIIIDYLGLLEDRYGNNLYERTTYISRRIKMMARTLNVPTFCVAQLSRALEQHVDKRPSLSDLRDSGALEQDPDVVLFLYRDDYYFNKRGKESEDPQHPIMPIGAAEIIIAKQRQGETGVIPLTWDRARRCYA